MVTISALRGKHVNYLWYKIRQLAVPRPWIFAPDVVSPDSIEDVVLGIVRSEILKKCGYHKGYGLDFKFIGYKEEAEKLIIEFAIFTIEPLLKKLTEEGKEDSVDYIQSILSVRFGCPVEFRLIEKRYSDQKSQFLDYLDLSAEPDIEIFEE